MLLLLKLLLREKYLLLILAMLKWSNIKIYYVRRHKLLLHFQILTVISSARLLPLKLFFLDGNYCKQYSSCNLLSTLHVFYLKSLSWYVPKSHLPFLQFIPTHATVILLSVIYMYKNLPLFLSADNFPFWVCNYFISLTQVSCSNHAHHTHLPVWQSCFHTLSAAPCQIWYWVSARSEALHLRWLHAPGTPM